jgi:hypothetical protein
MSMIRLHVIPTPPAPMGHPIAPPGYRFGLAPAANDDHANLAPPAAGGPWTPPARRRLRLGVATAVTAGIAVVGAVVLLFGSAVGC